MYDDDGDIIDLHTVYDDFINVQVGESITLYKLDKLGSAGSPKTYIVKEVYCEIGDFEGMMKSSIKRFVLLAESARFVFVKHQKARNNDGS